MGRSAVLWFVFYVSVASLSNFTIADSIVMFACLRPRYHRRKYPCNRTIMKWNITLFNSLRKVIMVILSHKRRLKQTNVRFSRRDTTKLPQPLPWFSQLRLESMMDRNRNALPSAPAGRPCMSPEVPRPRQLQRNQSRSRSNSREV